MNSPSIYYNSSQPEEQGHNNTDALENQYTYRKSFACGASGLGYCNSPQSRRNLTLLSSTCQHWPGQPSRRLSNHDQTNCWFGWSTAPVRGWIYTDITVWMRLGRTGGRRHKPAVGVMLSVNVPSWSPIFVDNGSTVELLQLLMFLWIVNDIFPVDQLLGLIIIFFFTGIFRYPRRPPAP